VVEVPFWPVAVPHVVRPALRQLAGATVRHDDGWQAAVGGRLARLRCDPDGVRVRDPADPDDAGLLAALVAALRVIRVDVPVALDHLPVGVREHLGGLRGWRRAADLAVLSQPADLVVLRRTAGGAVTAELLCVALPSGWPPRLRAGADLAALHAPVADGKRLVARSAALGAALVGKGPFGLGVWGVQRDDALAHDPSAPGGLPAPLPGGRWWLRLERQATTPLPALGRALFWIRPSLVPVSALSAERRVALAAAVRSRSSESLAYKGLADGLNAELLAALC